ncbi:glycosyltransferase family 39 protein [Streptomyces sp. NPDC000410]|uniref:glycosyltransferase family 39 protein n=1 Tax=Streptomyces sp. NPDC000410 TaxID=3154254 RepID=UPI003323B020
MNSKAVSRDAGDVMRGPLPYFLLPMAAALAAILPGIGRRQLWGDEHATWWASSLSFPDLGRLTEHVDAVFTPFYALMHGWSAVAGTSPAALRLPGGLAMAVSAGLVGLIGRRLFTPRTGLVAGLLFALVPMVTRYGQEARPYAFAMLFALLATLLLLRALERPTFKGWTLYAVAISLTGFSHLVALCVLAVHVLPVLRARRDGDTVAHWAFGCAALMGTSTVVPMMVRGFGQSGQIAWIQATTDDLARYPLELFGSWFVGAVVMGLAVVGLFTAGRTAPLLAVWAVLPPVLTFVTTDALHLFLPRYLLFTVPAWVLLAAAGAVRCADALTGAGRRGVWWRARGALLVTGAAAGYVLLVLPAVEAASQDLPHEPDYAGVARVVTAGQRPGDGIVYQGATRDLRLALNYELREGARPRDVLVWQTPQRRGWYSAAECYRPEDCLGVSGRLWLVTSKEGGTPGTARTGTAAVLGERFTVVRTERLREVTVQLLSRRAH